MCRSKVSSGAERWLCSVLNDCSQQCLSASSLQADNYTASTTAWQTQGKVTLPLHHLHCVKYHYIRPGLMKTLTWAFEWGINRCTDGLVQPDVNEKRENKSSSLTNSIQICWAEKLFLVRRLRKMRSGPLLIRKTAIKAAKIINLKCL